MSVGRNGDTVGGDILRIILSLVLPPIGVAMEVGISKQFWINCILTILGFLPGIIHAVYIIAKE